MRFDPTTDEIADRYADAYRRVLDLLADASDGDLTAPVPGTPDWTGRELLAHMVGCPADLVAGRFEGAGSDDWTQRQVDDRAGYSVARLIEEWSTIAPDVDAGVRAGTVPAPVTLDLLSHEADLRGALGAPATPDPLAVRFVTNGFGSRAVGVAAKADLPPLRLRAIDSDWAVGDEGGVVAAAPEYEWMRALAGRRSNAQVTTYDWSGDPTSYLDLLCPFGPLRSTDCTG